MVIAINAPNCVFHIQIFIFLLKENIISMPKHFPMKNTIETYYTGN